MIYIILITNAITFTLLALYFNHKIDKLNQKIKILENNNLYRMVDSNLKIGFKKGNLSDLK